MKLFASGLITLVFTGLWCLAGAVHNWPFDWHFTVAECSAGIGIILSILGLIRIAAP